MASVNTTLSPAAGFSYVLLAGTIEENSVFAVQPIADDQIAYEVSEVSSVSATLGITTTNTIYTLWHIEQDGTIWAIGFVYSVSLASTHSPDATKTYVTLDASIEPGLFSEWGLSPIEGNQLTSTTDDGVFDVNGNFSTGNRASVWMTILDGTVYAEEIQTVVETTLNFTSGASNTHVTLVSPVVADLFTDWTTIPVAGEQLTTVTTDGTFDVNGNFSNTDYDVHVWRTATDGTFSSQNINARVFAETTLNYNSGATKTTATLGETIDPYLFEFWGRLPVTGEQLTTTTTDGTFNSAGELETDIVGIIDTLFIAADGTNYSLTVDTTGLGQIQTVSISTTYGAGATKTVTTLGAGFDDFVFSEWVTPPVVGEQLTTTTTEGTFDTLANYTTELEGVFPFWFTMLNGQIYGLEIDSSSLITGLTNAPQSFVVSATASQTKKTTVSPTTQSLVVSVTASPEKKVLTTATSVSLVTSSSAQLVRRVSTSTQEALVVTLNTLVLRKYTSTENPAPLIRTFIIPVGV